MSTAVQPGTCVTHGWHGMTTCPRCSTAVGPFTPLMPPVTAHDDLATLREEINRGYKLESVQVALDRVEAELAAPCRCDRCHDCIAANGYEEAVERAEAAEAALADTRRALERAAYLIEHLVQQVPEFTGVIGPAGEREDDYIRDGIAAEAAGFRALASANSGLLNSARTSPPLREAVQRVEAHIAGLQQQVAYLEAEAEAESNGFRLLMQRAEAAEAQVAALTQERDAIGAALGEPCAECGHIDWRSDGYADRLLATVQHDLGAHRLMLKDERRWRAEAEKERDSWQKVAREYEAALGDRGLL